MQVENDVSSLDLNDIKELSERTKLGIEFQSELGPATVKAKEFNTARKLGISSVTASIRWVQLLQTWVRFGMECWGRMIVTEYYPESFIGECRVYRVEHYFNE